MSYTNPHMTFLKDTRNSIMSIVLTLKLCISKFKRISNMQVWNMHDNIHEIIYEKRKPIKMIFFR